MLAFNFVLILTLCGSVHRAVGDTAIGGDLAADKTLTPADQPYLVSQDLTVPFGKVLTVEPGVTVKLDSGVGVFVYGKIDARGTPQGRITFTASAQPAARLVNGKTRNEGRLEVLYQGEWGTVCNEGWDEDASTVACQMLGYSSGNATVNTNVDGLGPSLLKNVDCTGNEQSIFDCQHSAVGVAVCPHVQDVHLNCSEPTEKAVGFWSKIFIKNDQVPSVFEYVDIKYGGFTNDQSHGITLAVDDYEYDRRFDSFSFGFDPHYPIPEADTPVAVLSIGMAPILNSITIEGSAGNGVILHSGYSQISMTSSEIVDCGGHGLVIYSYTGAANLTGNKIRSNRGSGVVFEQVHRNASYQFCENNQPVNVSTDEPLVVWMDTSSTFLQFASQCRQVFQTSPENILEMQVFNFSTSDPSSWSSRNTLNVYNGYTVSEDTKLASIPMLKARRVYADPVYSNTSSMTLDLREVSSRVGEETRGFIIFTAMNGVATDELVIEQCHIINNQFSGLEMKNVLKPLNMLDSSTVRHSNYGIRVEGGRGGVKIISSNFDDNNWHLDLTRTLRNVTLQGNTFQNGTNTSVQCGLTESDIHLVSDYPKSIFIKNNDFLKNKKGVYIEEYFLPDETVVSNNVFDEHNDFAVKIINDQHDLSKLAIVENTFKRTTNGTALFIHANKKVEVKNNTFTDNTIFDYYSRNEVQGVVSFDFNSGLSLDFNYNYFNNPSSKYQISSWKNDYGVIQNLDISHNWWGTSNEVAIYHSVFDNTKRFNNRVKFQYDPFFSTSDMSATLTTSTTPNPVYNQTAIGGYVHEDLTLSNQGFPYIVIDDLNVLPNITLTIDPGVTLKFGKSVGIYVQGRLQVLGTEPSKVTLTGVSSATNVVGKWAGIHFSTSSQSSKIKHVVITRGGFIDADFNKFSAALLLMFNHHSISYIDIINCTTGLYQQSSDGASATKASNINIQNAEKDGIQILSGDLVLDAFHCENASRYGLSYGVYTINTLNNNLEEYVPQSSNYYLASLDDSVFFHGQLRGEEGVNFTTTPSLKLSFQLLSKYYTVYVSDTISNWTLMQPGDWISTETNELHNVHCISSSYCSVSFVVKAIADPEKSKGLWIQDSVFNKSRIYMRESLYQNRKLTAEFTFQNVILHNSETSIYPSMRISPPSVLFHNCKITTDSGWRALYIQGSSRRTEVVVENCEFNTASQSLDVEDCGNLTVTNSLFTQAKTNAIKAGECNWVWIENSIFQNFSTTNGIRITQSSSNSYDFVAQGAAFVHISKCTFKDTQTYDALIEITGRNTWLELEDSTFVRNSVESILETNIDYRNSSGIEHIFIINNAFLDNTNRYSFRSKPVIAIDKTKGVELHHNEFNNPLIDVDIQVSTFSQHLEDVVNASYNKWPCLNISCVQDRVRDAHESMYTPRVQLAPFIDMNGGINNEAYISKGIQGSILKERLFQSSTLSRRDFSYTITKNLTVMPGVVLTIEPGVVIEAERDVGILVLGDLIAKGSQSERILFRSKSTRDSWNGIVFAVSVGQTKSSASEMEYVEVHGAGSGMADAAVQVVSRDVVLDHVYVNQSDGNGIEILYPPGPIRVQNCEISNSKNIGINILTARPFNINNSLLIPVNTASMKASNYRYGVPGVCGFGNNTLHLEKNTVLVENIVTPSNYYTECVRTFKSVDGSNIILQLLNRPITSYVTIRLNVYNDSYMNPNRFFGNVYGPTSNIDTQSDTVTLQLVMYRNFWYSQSFESHTIHLALVVDKQLEEQHQSPHRISSNKLNNNGLGGLIYTAIGDGQRPVVIERNIFEYTTLQSAPTWNLIQQITTVSNNLDIAVRVKDADVTIANNLILNSVGAIYVVSENTRHNSAVNIWSNTIAHCSGYSGIVITGASSFGHKLVSHIDDNVITHNDFSKAVTFKGIELPQFKKVIMIQNSNAKITRNMMYNNSAINVILVSPLAIPNQTQQAVVDNFIYNNKPTGASQGFFGSSQRAAIVSTNPDMTYHSNYINNPSFTFEISSEGAYWATNSTVNATFNWWGTKSASGIKQRIRDVNVNPFYPEVDYVPYLTSPARFFSGALAAPSSLSRNGKDCKNDGYFADMLDCSRYYHCSDGHASVSFCHPKLVWNQGAKMCTKIGCTQKEYTNICPIGWVQSPSSCLQYNGGARSYKDAARVCEEQFSSVLGYSFASIEDERETVQQMLNARTKSGASVPIWVKPIESESPIANKLCSATDVSLQSFDRQCTDHLPFICKRSAVNSCPNGCSRHGRCKPTKQCSCDRGWEGEDCSQFHCRDRNNCGKYGECVGPNACKCLPGWQGRACSTSYCPVRFGCRWCTAEPGCGWCDSSQQCLPGTDMKPYIHQCARWFFHDCFSVGPKNGRTCSNQIEYIDCDSRQCNSTIRYANDEDCNRCKDVVNCFSPKNNDNCPVWNYSRCPSGFVHRDYESTSRLPNVVVHDNVHVLNPVDVRLYMCPAKMPDFNNVFEYEDSAVIVTRDALRFPTRRDFVLVSPQAGGVMHMVHHVNNSGLYSYMAARPARVQEIIKYADFNQSVPVGVQVEDIVTEHVPAANVYDAVIGLAALGGHTVHLMNSQNTFRCQGHLYSIQSKYQATQYIVVATGSSYSVGDIIAGGSSTGFMETVTDTQEDTYVMMYHTQRTACNESMNVGRIVQLVTANSLHCSGGKKDDQGLTIVHKDIHSNVSIAKDDIVINRKSGTGNFLGQIVSTFDKNGYTFIEIIPVVSTVGNAPQTSIDHKLFAANKRVSERSRKQFQASFSRDLHNAVNQEHVLNTSLEINVNFEMHLELYMTSEIPNIKKAGIRFENGLDIKIDNTYESLKSSGHKAVNPVNDDQVLHPIPNFHFGKYCLQINPLICLPIHIGLDMKYNYVSDIKDVGQVVSHVKAVMNFSAGATWRYRNGGLEILRSTTPTTFDISTSVDSTFGNGELTVNLLPVFTVIWPFSYVQKNVPVLPPMLNGIFDTEPYFSKPLLDMKINTPFEVSIPVSTCSSICTDVSKPVHVLTNTGITEIGMELTATMGMTELKYSELGQFYTEVHATDSQCISGKADSTCPKTGCSCPDGKPSIQDSNGACQCTLCPDSNTRKVTLANGQTSCPCFCADGKEMANMNEDGSCPCQCQCKNGKQGIIDSSGKCQCACTCNNCEDSLIDEGTGECICPNDRCPICDFGYEPIWEDCQCRCREKTQCGIAPACVVGRKGPTCGQSDCEPCSIEGENGELLECSGNGRCYTFYWYSCASWCFCDWRWTGRCCDRRLPRNLGGDPHLQTADGISYDYHGIGEFWDCKSEANDFGVQVRMFGYKQASLIGAAAVKAGESVITVTTPTSANSNTLPNLRIDGVIQDLSSFTSTRLSNDSILLDVKAENTSGSGAVMMISLQYQSGVSVTIDVRYSASMGRLFLNIRSTLTAKFKSKTSGLCGLMDDDDTNDFTMPNGTVVAKEKAIEFGESWRISQSFAGSGLQNSWQWGYSNFHVDDTMDPSYTDPSLYSPAYTPVNISDADRQLAEQVCLAKGLDGVLLQECIYDVAVTNDTSFSEQETFQLGCVNQCNGKGRCDNGTCICSDGWSGEECQIGSCGACFNGECDSGFCECNLGWEGNDCGNKATCLSLNNCTDETHGVCARTNVCQCKAGYIGADCSIVPTCANVAECSNHGDCVDIDKCQCDKGWGGDDCTTYSCEDLAYCSGHGQCTGFDYCQCEEGWLEDSCSTPDCSTNNDCSTNGVCVGPSNCSCADGYTGTNCSETINCTALNNCNENGLCYIDKTTGNEVTACRCFTGYEGVDCSNVSCSEVNDCSGQGNCTEPNFCECLTGFAGTDCSNFSCEINNYCSGNGDCLSFDICTCYTGWSGDECDVANCSGVNDCSLKGDCIAPDQCSCYAEYDGNDCSLLVGPNLNAPVFSSDVYEVTLTENTPAGTTILLNNGTERINATDADVGKNGRVTYFLGDALDFLNINLETGELTTVNTVDHDILDSGNFSISVIATDGGTPSKSTSAKLNIIVIDLNDNTPEFPIPFATEIEINANASSGELITFRASDKDSGNNGLIKYSIRPDTNPSAVFGINETTGVLSVLIYPQQTRYDLVIIAEDQGSPRKSSEYQFTVRVTGTIVSVSLSDLFKHIQENTITTPVPPDSVTTADILNGTVDMAANDTNITTTMSIVAATEAWYDTVAFQAGIGATAGVIVAVSVGVVIYFIVKSKSVAKVSPQGSTVDPE